MDQLRKIGGWLAQHHFWVLVGLATLIAMACWYSGASVLNEQFAQNKSKIEAQFNAIASLRNKPFHANQEINEKQQEQIAAQQQAVNELWRQLYDRQRAEVLKWPANLSQQFRDRVERLKFGDPIELDLRAHYNNYVRDHFPNLPKIVGARAITEGDLASGRGSMDLRGLMSRRGMGSTREAYAPVDPNQPMEEEQDYLVEWLDQPTIYNDLYMPRTPSSDRIWKTQEDLWVYEALLRIIANTNKAAGADRFANAAVRVIETLEVGRAAAQASRTRGRFEIRGPAAAVDMGGEPFGEMDGGRGGVIPESGAMGEMYGGESFGRGPMDDAAAEDQNLFVGRYVGPDGKPIPDPSAAGKEFKRLPIRLRLWMDQRWLPQLLAECANAPLQVEVQEVRINPSETGTAGSGYRGGGREAYPSMSGTAGGEVMVPEREPNMKTVVIQGIIYIFNPPTFESPAGQVAAQ